MSEMNVTPLETMRIASMGSLVSIPGFGDGDFINVRLRKANLLSLAKMGKIPNELLNDAESLFAGGKKDGKKGHSPQELSAAYELMSLFCEACLVEPSYKEMKENGIELTQEQMQFILGFATGGLKSLKPFRNESGTSLDTGNGGTVANTTESAA